jgi:hypothetical protein
VSDWWAGLPPAQTMIGCSDEQHRLRWEEGRLQALDHADADRERTLAALGGQRCACVDLLDAWARHAGDLRVLVAASRGPSDPLGDPSAAGGAGMPTQMLAPGRGRLRPRPGAGSLPRPGAVRRGGTPNQPDPDDELIGLLALGGGVPERLVAATLAEWSQRLDARTPETEAEAAKLHAALYGRAAAAIRSWLGEPSLIIETRVIESKGEPRLGAVDDGVRAELPFSWLLDVWCKGLVTIAGRFTLSAAVTDRGWTLSTIAPDLGPPSPMTID